LRESFAGILLGHAARHSQNRKQKKGQKPPEGGLAARRSSF